MQSAAKGRSVSHYLQAVSPQDVLTNKRYKVLGTPLKDWLVCSKCNSQQIHHSQSGGDFDKKCWRCEADHTHFMYMDELARELPADEKMYRFKR